VWDLVQNETIFRGAHYKRVECLDFSFDGRMLASASDDRSFAIWDLESDKKVHVLQAKKVFGVAFNPTATILATACDDCSVHLWRLK
jgi:WD40 repeat protein